MVKTILKLLGMTVTGIIALAFVLSSYDDMRERKIQYIFRIIGFTFLFFMILIAHHGNKISLFKTLTSFWSLVMSGICIYIMYLGETFITPLIWGILIAGYILDHEN